MMNKYKVTKEFMDKLVAWRDERSLDATSGSVFNTVGTQDLDNLPSVTQMWRLDTMGRNNRTIAIIQWLNGEDVFEVEQSNKFVVRSRKADEDGYYAYVNVSGELTDTTYMIKYATKFDTYAEAQEWANSHQVVIEVDEDGKEV